MARKKSLEKELAWREIVKRQAEGGLSVRKFCATEGISEPSFYAWRRKLRQRRSDKARPRESRRHGDEPGNGRLFVPLKLFDANRTVEIIHPLGYRVQLTGDLNPVALRQVLEVLDERGGQ